VAATPDLSTTVDSDGSKPESGREKDSMGGQTILYIATSVDGFVAGSRDEVDWMDRYESVEYGFNDFLRSVGAIIMGRRSYDVGVDQNWFSEFDYGSPIIVVSTNTPDSISGDADFTFVTDGIEAAHEQARLKASGKNIWIFGGASIAQQYARAGLLDEIYVGIVPLILGDGKRLFEEVGKRIPLRLLDANRFDQGLVLHHYAVE
jgi:dihydrofolate reductase